MNKELRFFANTKDENEFIEFFTQLYTNLDKTSKYQWKFYFEDKHIQYLRSRKHSEVLTIGRISIRTSDKSEYAKQAESAFRKMEKWIKNTYTDNLYVQNPNIANSLSKAKNIWIAPHAKYACIKNNVILKESEDSFSIYQLENKTLSED